VTIHRLVVILASVLVLAVLFCITAAFVSAGTRDKSSSLKSFFLAPGSRQ
jgi:hypothetical protein